MASERGKRCKAKSAATISSRSPAEVRKALGVKLGDVVAYEVVDGTLQVSRVRPSIDTVLDSVLEEFDFSELQEATRNDAVSYVCKFRR